MFRLWMRSLDELSDAISFGHTAADTLLTSDRRRAMTDHGSLRGDHFRSLT